MKALMARRSRSLQSGPAVVVAHVLEHDFVIRRIDDHGDRFVILRRAADHGGPADVDILDRFGQGDVRLGDRFLERIKIHHHQIDRLEPALLRFGDVPWIVALIEQAAVHARVQGFDPALQHFRKRGETGNVAHRNFFFPKQFRRAAGGNDIDALTLQGARKIGDAGLVRNGNESAGDLHQEME